MEGDELDLVAVLQAEALAGEVVQREAARAAASAMLTQARSRARWRTGALHMISFPKEGERMADVVIRDLDEAVMERLRRRAAERGEPLERVARDILAGAVRPDLEERLAGLRRIRAMSPPLPADAPRSEDLIREDRDAR